MIESEDADNEDFEQLLILKYPEADLDGISRIVQEHGSFVALITGDIYKIPQYYFSSKLTEFTAILDRNVYTRITTLARSLPVPPIN